MVRCRIARCLIAPTLKAGADGLYEIRAACRIWDFRCIVFPTSECLEPFHVHGHAKKRVVALYFTGHHYDLLGCDNGSLPKSILAIRGSPEAVPMRGGGAHDNDVDSGFLGIWLQTATNREQFGTLWDANSSVALTLGRPDIELDIDEAPQAKEASRQPGSPGGRHLPGALQLLRTCPCVQDQCSAVLHAVCTPPAMAQGPSQDIWVWSPPRRATLFRVKIIGPFPSSVLGTSFSLWLC